MGSKDNEKKRREDVALSLRNRTFYSINAVHELNNYKGRKLDQKMPDLEFTRRVQIS